MLDSGTEASPAEFDGKEGLAAGSVVQLATKNKRKSGELKAVKVVVGSKKVGGVACAETIGEFREGEAVAKEAKLNLSVIEGREEIKDLIDFTDAPIDDVLSEADIANWPTEEGEAGVGGAGNVTLEWIGDVNFRRQRISAAAPNERLLGVDVETDFWSPGAEKVEGALEGGAITGERQVIEVGDVEEEVGAIFFELE